MNLIPLWVKLAALAALASLLAAAGVWAVHHERDLGRAEVQAKWDVAVSLQRAADLAKSEANARETAERIRKQEENQRAQDKELAAARAAAARNADAADQLRSQLAATAQRWSAALADPPVDGDRQAAAAAIGVLTDVLGRADRRAGVLASYADAARAAGLKCQRDYEALKTSLPASAPIVESPP